MSARIGAYRSKLEIMNLFCNKHGMTRHSKAIGKKKWKCCECMSDVTYNYKTRQKQRAIDYKGGSCMRCGFNECNSVMHFHHRNPSEKSFDLTKQNLSKSWEKIVTELDKCDLLCIRCHLIEHERLDQEERQARKSAMKPDIYMDRKAINRFNCKILGVPSQP